MMSTHLLMAPVLTTPAGTCMTTENWQAANVTVASFYLSALLMKPGLDSLKRWVNLASYVGWEDKILLNATLPNKGTDDRYLLRSPYDGSRSWYTLLDILAIITTLKPDMVILPEGVLEKNWLSLPEKIIPFLSVMDLPQSTIKTRPYGVYILYDETTSEGELFAKLSLYRDLPCLVMGEVGLSLMLKLVHYGVQFVESDKPATAAVVGDVYSSQGLISLQDSAYAMQFEVIDANCMCPVCSQKLTRAYLHHLLEHTPLLCQRYLVQHNLYYCQTALLTECK